jgi:hypothetical protein
MPDYLFVYHLPNDYVPGKTATLEAWQTWFAQLGEQLVDSGKPVTVGEPLRSLNGSGRLSGYSIIHAPDLDTAVKIAHGCPNLAEDGSVEVGELRAHTHSIRGTNELHHIRHRIGIRADLRTVREALLTAPGISRWWTEDATDQADGTVATYFGRPSPSAVMRIDSTGSRVTWECVEGPEEWIGTTLTFDIGETDQETVVLFTHAGWRDPVPFMHHCSTKWAIFLLSLKHAIEDGDATPYPHDEAISTWG